LATNLVNKNVLITAGPTWVAIDNVRVISNIATGETGVMLAKELALKGAKITLLLGPGKDYNLGKNITVIRFKFFDELSSLLKILLKRKKYAAIVHSAAVADYKPEIYSKKKISSALKYRRLNLRKTPKIILSLHRLSRNSLLVGFKFEPDLTEKKLIEEGRLLLKKAKLDLVVANSLTNKHYSAYLINSQEISGPFFSKKTMTKSLVKSIVKNLCKS